MEKLSWDFNFGIPSTLDVETILVVTLGPLVGKEEFEAQSRQNVLESGGGGEAISKARAKLLAGLLQETAKIVPEQLLVLGIRVL